MHGRSVSGSFRTLSQCVVGTMLGGLIGTPSLAVNRSTVEMGNSGQSGLAEALILSHWRTSDGALIDAEHRYKKLSAVDLEKVLPMDERSARRHLKKMLDRDLLVQHETKPKYYRLGKYAGKSPKIEQATAECGAEDELLVA